MLIQLTEDLTETQLENVAASVGLYLSPAIGKYKGEVLRIMRPIGLAPVDTHDVEQMGQPCKVHVKRSLMDLACLCKTTGYRCQVPGHVK